MKQSLRTVGSWSTILGLLLLMALVMSPAVSLHAQINAVYVESNIGTVANGNTVIGYSNDGAGTLTLLPGSPYSTGGTGVIPPPGFPLGFQTDDDQQIIINKAGTKLFAVNGRSNTVASFTINSDGSLTPNGFPISSAGTQPASLGLFDGVLSGGGSLLVVVNKSSDPGQTNSKAPNVVTFTVSSSGTMSPNVGTKVPFPTGDSPSQAAIGTAHLTFVQEFMGVPSKIDSYRVQKNGKLTLNNSVNVPTANVFLGEVVHPTQNFLFAALPADSAIAVYSYSSGTGMLSFVTTAPISGLLPCWLAINADGSRLYSGNTMSLDVSVVDTSNPSAPVELQTIKLVGGGGPSNLRLDPTGKFLYVVAGLNLHVMNVLSDGTLSETASPVALPVPSGNFPYGLATVLK
jgi:6-phosphogluconolactonase (cycloisomerase 2 family)